MKIVKTVQQWRRVSSESKNRTLGFVPTMGALHEGHLSLVRRSMDENDETVVCIYLNPTQFDQASDLQKYPKSLEQDRLMLEELGVSALFLPDYETIYPDDYRYKISENSLSQILCGAKRPGHFDGVLTVVMKLLNIIGADKAYFGEKDFQQYLLIRGMAEAFFLETEIVPCPLIREESGLAMSSRNMRLSPEGRLKAAEFYKTLSSGKRIEEIKKILEEKGFTVDYVEEHDGRIFGAVFLEEVRLIDNVKR